MDNNNPSIQGHQLHIHKSIHCPKYIRKSKYIYIYIYIKLKNVLIRFFCKWRSYFFSFATKGLTSALTYFVKHERNVYKSYTSQGVNLPIFNNKNDPPVYAIVLYLVMFCL